MSIVQIVPAHFVHADGKHRFETGIDPRIQQFGQKQFHRISLMGALGEDNIQMHGRLYPVPESEMAAAFTGQPETLSALSGYLPDNLSMGASMNADIQKLRPLMDALVGIVAR